MSGDAKAILSDASEIFFIVKNVFPDTVLVNLDRMAAVGSMLNMQFRGRQLSLTTAVLRKEFLEYLSYLKGAVLCQESYVEDIRSQEGLDPERFVVEGRELSGWNRFQRILFEQRGGQIVNEIMRFLTNNDARTLASLGLDPDQLRENFDNFDLTYFRDFFQYLETMKDAQQKSILFPKICILYPAISSHILREKCRDQIARYPAADLFGIYWNRLKKMVIGQDLATRCAADALSESQRNTVFLFVGPTGVGKTELALSIAKVKDANQLVKFEMAGYSSEYDAKSLFGSPFGLVGSTDKPVFVKKLEEVCSPEKVSDGKYKCEGIVMLFDEMEKAHPTLRQALLNLFDKHECTVSYITGSSAAGGNVSVTYCFEKSIFVSTSNLFQAEIKKDFLQSPDDENLIQRRERIAAHFIELNGAYRNIDHKYFSPEFLGRIMIIPFAPVPKGAPYIKILRKNYVDFCSGLKENHGFSQVSIENLDAFFLAIQEKIYGDGTDLRRIERDHFSAINTKIKERGKDWGDPKNVKLVFTCNEQGPVLKVWIYLESFSYWQEIELISLR